MRMVLVILAALIVAGGTGFYVIEAMRPAPEPVRVEAPAPRVEVYVAARAIPTGMILTPDHLDRMAVGAGAPSPEMIVADEAGSAMIAGSVARQPLAAGMPIARSAIMQPGERGFLAAVLPRGKRAITIPIEEAGSLSGLAEPGDRVDVILTYAIADAGSDQEPVRASETVLANLRVLAFDQRLGPRQETLMGSFETPPMARTATLEVTPREAEVMTLSQTIGTLSLVLHSVRDDNGRDDNGSDAYGLDGTGKLELTGGPLAASGRAPQAAGITLSSDVTSTARVQVVRGSSGRATVPSPLSPAPAAAE